MHFESKPVCAAKVHDVLSRLLRTGPAAGKRKKKRKRGRRTANQRKAAQAAFEAREAGRERQKELEGRTGVMLACWWPCPVLLEGTTWAIPCQTLLLPRACIRCQAAALPAGKHQQRALKLAPPAE